MDFVGDTSFFPNHWVAVAMFLEVTKFKSSKIDIISHG
jgi:hypothetical protein